MKISLLHPSRGRSQQAFDNYQNWMRKTSRQHQIEHILSLDSSDPQLEDYKRLFAGVSNIVVNDNHCVVQATNQAARLASGDVLLYLSDDFDCPNQWDHEIAKVAPPRPEYMIWVNDCVQGTNTVLTIPIMSKGLYQALGYFWHPDYLSMWVDVDLWHVCKRRNVLVMAHHLRFEHKHYSVGKATYDETYQNHDNPERKQQGWTVFCRRQADNFMTNGAIK